MTISSEKRPPGRPKQPFNWPRAERILADIESGLSVTKAAAKEGLTVGAVMKWTGDQEGFGLRYARSRTIGYEAMAAELTNIADGDSVNIVDGVIIPPDPQRDRLRVDTRKWILSKMLPKIYGDKQLVELANKDDKPLLIEQSPDQIARSIAFALAAGLRSRDMGDVVEVDKPKLEDGTNE